MRVFCFPVGLRLTMAALALALNHPSALAGQWPGEVVGVVRDAQTGSPLPGASVTFDAATRAIANSAGRFHLVGLSPGTGTLRVEAHGYSAYELRHTAANGRIDFVEVTLGPDPFRLEPLVVTGRSAGSHEVDRRQIQAAGATTLGDAVRLLPSVVVVDRGTGSAQTVSVRGSDADGVLVLVDGVPINDVLTGEADLSAVSAEAIESATLHVGASSAHFGSGATAGVLDVRTRVQDPHLQAAVGAGSLGSTFLQLERGLRAGTWSGGAAVSHRSLDGRFDFVLPESVGGAAGVRGNADQTLTALRLAADRGGPTRIQIRGSAERQERGLPGPGFNPSVHARQRSVAIRLSMTAARSLESTEVESRTHFSHTRRRFSDPAPPAGLPYDEESRLSDAAVEASARRMGDGWLATSEVGTAVRGQRISSDALSDTAPASIVDVGTWVAATIDPGLGPLRLHARLRLDGAGSTRQWQGTHSVTVAVPQGRFSIELSHRSAFNPPSLADQFFREGVGVRANPDLQAERVPSEVEVSARFAASRIQVGASTYAGDVKGRIVWQPDFRFLWSPTNTDVRRRGLDLWLATQPRSGLSVRSNYSYARTTYDRPGAADSVQLAYRPRHSASITARYARSEWAADVAAHYTGLRYPVPAPVNALPAFTTLDLSVTRSWTRPGWGTDVTARIHRALDSHETLIFGFPDPGRTLSLEVRLRRNSNQIPGTP